MNRLTAKTGALAAALACISGAAPQTVAGLTDIEEAQGFHSLFDGTLRSFNDHFVNYRQGDSGNVVLSSDWKVDAALGALTTDGNVLSNLRSTEKYADFDFRFDYRNDGDGGVFYRFTLGESAPWYTGVEFSILDDEDNCVKCAGAAQDLYGPVPLVYRPFATGEWNRGRIVVVKDSVEHWLNGRLVVGYRYHSEDFWKRFDAGRWASTSLTFKEPGNRWGGYIESGYLGFQSLEKSHWQLRNLRINAVDPRLGPDKWWNSLEAPSSVFRDAASVPFRSAGAASAMGGSISYRASGGAPVTADGRTASP